MGHWADRYVGLPAEGKRPCWMLVRQIWHEQLRFLLPRYDEFDNPQEAISLNEEGFVAVPIGLEQAYDIALMKEPIKVKGKVHHHLESHVGIVAARGLVLHVHEGEFSRITPIKDLSVSRIFRGPWGVLA